MLDVAATIDALSPRTKLLFLCNPNNPTGTVIPCGDFEVICRAASPDTLIVVDEAYYEYARGDDYPESLELLSALKRKYLVLRTFSKAYALAGLRIGYGIASEDAFVRHLDLVRTAFNVNRVAQLAARAAWSDEAAVQAAVKATIAERERVASALRERGYAPAQSRANFLFFNVRQPAAELAERLLRLGVIIKPWGGSFASWIRVSIGRHEDNDHFLASLDECV